MPKGVGYDGSLKGATGSMNSGGSPKSSTMGKDTSLNSTNVIKVLGHNPAEISPSATKQSHNRGMGGK